MAFLARQVWWDLGGLITSDTPKGKEKIQKGFIIISWEDGLIEGRGLEDSSMMKRPRPPSVIWFCFSLVVHDIHSLSLLETCYENCLYWKKIFFFPSHFLNSQENQRKTDIFGGEERLNLFI